MTIILTSLFWIWALPVVMIFGFSAIVEDNPIFTSKEVKGILLWPYYIGKLLWEKLKK